MLRMICGKTLRDGISNKVIRNRACRKDDKTAPAKAKKIVVKGIQGIPKKKMEVI